MAYDPMAPPRASSARGDRAQHTMDRRATLLAGRITQLKNTIRDMAAPPKGKPAFMERLSEADALAFWRAERHTPLGLTILARWQPWQVATLDARLSDAIEARGGLLESVAADLREKGLG